MTKRELMEKCSLLLYKKKLSKDDKKFLTSILEMHPDYKSKIGIGIKDFFRKKTPYGTTCFFILRDDNTLTDFSFKKCITHPSNKTKIRQACRTAVVKSIQRIRTRKGYIIHHDELEFETIVVNWLSNNPNIDCRIKPSKDNFYKTEFKSLKTSISFKQYHDSVATLIEITKEEHKLIHYQKETEVQKQ